MSLQSRFSLQFGLTAALGVALALAASLALFAARMDAMSEDLRDDVETAIGAQMRKSAEALAGRFAEQIREPLLDYDRQSLTRAARDTLALTGAQELRIYDAHGRGVASGAEDGAAFASGAPAPLRALDDPDGVARWIEGDRLFSGRAVCIGPSCIGTVAVGVDGTDALREGAALAAEMDEAERSFFREAGLLGLGALILAALLAALVGWLLGRRLTRSLRGAVDALDQIAAGATDVSFDAQDAQLAELAAAVERVAESMANGKTAEAGILDDMTDGLFVARLDGEMVVANAALHELLGAAPPELVGASAFETFAIDPAETLEQFVERISGVSRITRRDGAGLTVMVSAKVAPGGVGVEGRVVGVVRDATAMAADIGRLRAAEARAEAANKAKTEFLSVMSHELRTPLNGILGGAAVLAGSELNPSQRSFVDIVQNSGKSLLTMVTDILDLTRIESGDAKVEESPVDVEELAQEIIAAVSEDAAAKNLKLLLRVQPGMPVISTDRDKLREIGSTLTENAVKFTEEGSVGLDVSYETVDGVVTLKLKVEDTGPGIDPAHAETIFDTFSQGDSSASRKHGGAGLGLAITRKLVELMGGKISVESTPGEGATFTVTLDAPVDADQPAKPRKQLPNIRTLVAAADKLQREALAEQLAHAGAKVETAQSATVALRMLESAQEKRQPFGLVVHPEDLPGFASSGLAEWLRGDGPAQSVASVSLRPESAMLDGLAQLPERVVLARTPPSFDDLIDAAMRAHAVAIGENAEDDDAAPPAPAPVDEEETRWPTMKVIEGDVQTPHVILAEHNEVNRIVLTSFLKKSGYEVHPAANGFDAVKLYKELMPKLIVMDVTMPLMNGLDAAKAVRRHEQEIEAPACVMIGLTDRGKEGERERCTAAGMNDSIQKPVKLDELEAKIERWASLFGGAEKGARTAAS
ncbi:hybrid sensor histidine kinase/response regulator [Rubrimonas sp.]|uniref:hybrid sensor histidine kinase/response regulator n=1 Tax=Rubrimonas sp. TaxID=2036015 RepID=UPI002FDECFDD